MCRQRRQRVPAALVAAPHHLRNTAGRVQLLTRRLPSCPHDRRRLLTGKLRAQLPLALTTASAAGGAPGRVPHMRQEPAPTCGNKAGLVRVHPHLHLVVLLQVLVGGLGGPLQGQHLALG